MYVVFSEQQHNIGNDSPKLELSFRKKKIGD